MSNGVDHSGRGIDVDRDAAVSRRQAGTSLGSFLSSDRRRFIERLAYAATKSMGRNYDGRRKPSTAKRGARFRIRVAQRAAALVVVAASIFTL